MFQHSVQIVCVLCGAMVGIQARLASLPPRDINFSSVSIASERRLADSRMVKIVQLHLLGRFLSLPEGSDRLKEQLQYGWKINPEPSSSFYAWPDARDGTVPIGQLRWDNNGQYLPIGSHNWNEQTQRYGWTIDYRGDPVFHAYESMYGSAVPIVSLNQNVAGLIGQLVVKNGKQYKEQIEMYGWKAIGTNFYAYASEVCTVTKTQGYWKYITSGNEGKEYGLEVGIAEEESKEVTEEWSSSMTASLELGLEVSGAVLGTGTTASATVGFSAEFGKSVSKSYSTAWTRSETTSTKETWSYDGLALWQFSMDSEDSCGSSRQVKLAAFAWTSGRNEVPRCLPGYCDTRVDAHGRCCTCKEDGEIAGTPSCSNPHCAAGTPVSVILGTSVQLKLDRDIDASTSASGECGSINPEFGGEYTLRCTEDSDLVADVSGCSKGELPTGPVGEANQCICIAGLAATGLLCPSMGATFCTSCHTGYIRNPSSHDCEKEKPTIGSKMQDVNQCICTAGTAAIAPLCPSMGATYCTSCNSGYFRNPSSHDCEKEEESAEPRIDGAAKVAGASAVIFVLHLCVVL